MDRRYAWNGRGWNEAARAKVRTHTLHLHNRLDVKASRNPPPPRTRRPKRKLVAIDARWPTSIAASSPSFFILFIFMYFFLSFRRNGDLRLPAPKRSPPPVFFFFEEERKSYENFIYATRLGLDVCLFLFICGDTWKRALMRPGFSPSLQIHRAHSVNSSWSEESSTWSWRTTSGILFVFHGEYLGQSCLNWQQALLSRDAFVLERGRD